jgi:hypothetical protein
MEIARINAMTNRVLAGPLLAGECAVHDHDVVPAIVGCIERSAPEEFLSDGAEVPRSDLEDIRRLRVGLIASLGMYVSAKTVTINSSAERFVIGSGYVEDAGKDTQLSQSLFQNGKSLCGFDCGVECGAAQINAGKKQAIRFKSERLIQQDQDGRYHPSGARDQYERHAELCGNK